MRCSASKPPRVPRSPKPSTLPAFRMRFRNIAHNPGNQLSVTRQADFALANGGAWKLQSIE